MPTEFMEYEMQYVIKVSENPSNLTNLAKVIDQECLNDLKL